MRFPTGIVVTTKCPEMDFSLWQKFLFGLCRPSLGKGNLNMRAKQSQLLNGKPVKPVWQCSSLASVGSFGPRDMGGKMVFSLAPGDRCLGRIDKSPTPASSPSSCYPGPATCSSRCGS
uniref:Uncharacterized protein n=1 Tax=Micrurus carvalhoi TaxID=3147026 RepID=A0A2H6MXR3_9SAUR